MRRIDVQDSGKQQEDMIQEQRCSKNDRRMMKRIKREIICTVVQDFYPFKVDILFRPVGVQSPVVPNQMTLANAYPCFRVHRPIIHPEPVERSGIK